MQYVGKHFDDKLRKWGYDLLPHYSESRNRIINIPVKVYDTNEYLREQIIDLLKTKTGVTDDGTATNWCMELVLLDDVWHWSLREVESFC